MTVRVRFRLRLVELVIRVQVKQKAFQLRHDALFRDMDFCQAVYRLDSVLDILKLFWCDQIRLIHDNNICMRYLDVSGSHDRAVTVMLVAFNLAAGVVEALQDVLCIDKCYDTIEIDGASEAVVNPEERCKVARISQASCL